VLNASVQQWCNTRRSACVTRVQQRETFNTPIIAKNASFDIQVKSPVKNFSWLGQGGASHRAPHKYATAKIDQKKCESEQLYISWHITKKS